MLYNTIRTFNKKTNRWNSLIDIYNDHGKRTCVISSNNNFDFEELNRRSFIDNRFTYREIGTYVVDEDTFSNIMHDADAATILVIAD